jgi:hypothetical protein
VADRKDSSEVTPTCTCPGPRGKLCPTCQNGVLRSNEALPEPHARPLRGVQEAEIPLYDDCLIRVALNSKGDMTLGLANDHTGTYFPIPWEPARKLRDWLAANDPAQRVNDATAVPPKKTAKIVLESVKDPDGWWELITALGLGGDDPESAKKRKAHWEWGEYASVEIEVDEDLNIIGGRILPL